MSRLVCAIVATALCWPPPAMSEPLDIAFLADIDSMESCVLETAHVGEEDSCAGLIASGCVEDGHALHACIDHEIRVWSAIATDMLETLGGATKFTSGCGATGSATPDAECHMRAMARFAADLLLRVEG